MPDYSHLTKEDLETLARYAPKRPVETSRQMTAAEILALGSPPSATSKESNEPAEAPAETSATPNPEPANEALADKPAETSKSAESQSASKTSPLDEVPQGFAEEDWKAMSERARKQVLEMRKGMTEKFMQLEKDRKDIAAVWDALEKQGILRLAKEVQDIPEFWTNPDSVIERLKKPASKAEPEKESDESPSWAPPEDAMQKSIKQLQASLKEVQQKLEYLSALEKKRQEHESLMAFNDGLASVREMAKAEGIQLTQEDENEIVDYIADTGASFDVAFERIMGPKIRKMLRAKLQEHAVKPSDKKQLQTSVKVASPTVPPVPPPVARGPKRPQYEEIKTRSRDEILRILGVKS